MPFLVPDKPFPCCLAPYPLIPLSPIHNPRFSPKIQENRPRGKKNRQNAWPYQKHSVSLHPLRPLYSILGEMAEWSNAPVLKTGVLQGTGGSNPSLSAKVSVTSCKTTSCADFSFKGVPNLRQNFSGNRTNVFNRVSPKTRLQFY